MLAKVWLVLHSGLHRLYTTEQHCWIQPFFEEMGRQSPALVVISVAIQGYLDDRARGLSVESMERIDLALQTFRQELDDRHEKMHTATVCAGLLVCTICVGPSVCPHSFALPASAPSYNSHLN